MRGERVREEADLGERRAVWWGRVVVVVGIAALGTLARLPTFRFPLDQDGSVFAYVAKVWSEGGLPYKDVWDHKPPLIYLAYRALFFVAPPESCDVNLTLRVGSLAGDLATALALLALCWRLFDFRRGAFAAVLYVCFAATPILQDEAFQPERLTTLLTVAGLLAAVEYVRRRRLWISGLSGLLFGLALVTKQVAAPVGALTWAWVTWEVLRSRGRGGWRRVLAHSVAMALGVLVPWAVCFAYFAARGALADFWECVFTYNLFYASAERKGSLLAGVIGFVRNGLFDHGFLWAAGAVGLVVALVRERSAGLLVLLWAAGAALGLILPGQFAAYYYVPTVAPFAAASAVGVLWVWGMVRSRRPVWLRASVALVASVVWGGCLFVAAKRAYGPGGRYEFATDPNRTNAAVARVARFIRDHTEPGEAVYMRGGRMQVYILSGRRSVTRFMYDFYYGLPPERAYHFKPAKLREIMTCMERERPRWVVITTRGKGKGVFDGAWESLERYFPAFKRYVQANYSLERTWEAHPVSLMVFRRNQG